MHMKRQSTFSTLAFKWIRISNFSCVKSQKIPILVQQNYNKIPSFLAELQWRDGDIKRYICTKSHFSQTQKSGKSDLLWLDFRIPFTQCARGQVKYFTWPYKWLVYSHHTYMYDWKEKSMKEWQRFYCYFYGVDLPSLLSNLLGLCYRNCHEIVQSLFVSLINTLEWVSEQSSNLEISQKLWGWGEMCPINDHIFRTASHLTLLWLN